MKIKQLTAMYLLFVVLFCYGQNDYPPCVAYENHGKDTILVKNSHSNSLYAGIDNPIEISKKSVPFKNILIECSMGMALEDGPNYIVIPAKPGKIMLTLYQYDKGDTVIVLRKLMNVLKVPAPYVVFGGTKISELKHINKIDLLKNNAFKVHLSEDFINDSLWFSVKEITVGYPFGQLYVTKTCEGPKFSDEIRKAITQLIPGSEMSFSFTLAGEGDLYKRIGPIRIMVH
jgi:hypothetical protein